MQIPWNSHVIIEIGNIGSKIIRRSICSKSRLMIMSVLVDIVGLANITDCMDKVEEV